MARATSSAAPSPCTRALLSSTRVHGARASITHRISCRAAPLAEVTTPTQAGHAGSARLRAGSVRPSISSLRRRRSNAWRHNPSPSSAVSLRTRNWYLPRASYSVTEPNARTRAPLIGSAGRRRASLANMTAPISAASSLSVKYRCPPGPRFQSPTSPATHRAGTPCSSSSRARRLTCATVQGSAARPGSREPRSGSATGVPGAGRDPSPPAPCWKRSSDSPAAAIERPSPGIRPRATARRRRPCCRATSRWSWGRRPRGPARSRPRPPSPRRRPRRP